MQKKLTTEEYLKWYFSKELTEINKYKTREERIYYFLKVIGFSPEEPILIDAINVSCNLKKVTYQAVSEKLSAKYKSNSNTFIKHILDDEFKDWIQRYPKIKKEYKTISIINILKLFAKNYK